MEAGEQEASKRSIQDIIPPARSKPLRPPPVISQTPLPPPPRESEPLHMTTDGNNKRYFFLIVAVVAVVLIAAGIAVASTVFHRAYVEVTPYTFDVELNDTFQSTVDDVVLPYTKTSVEEVATKNVAASSSRQVQDRATGTLTV